MFDRNKKNPADPPAGQTVRDTVRLETPPAVPEVRPQSAPVAAPPTAPATGRRSTTVIGPSIHMDGHLRGEEDIYVEGEVTGTVHLQNNTLTIGTQGRLKADVFAHTVYVEGTMEGDLFGSDQVIIRKSARIRGNIASPRVTLEDGATFKGSIEMDPESVKQLLGGASGAGRSASQPGNTYSRPAPAPAIAESVQKGSVSR